LDLLAQRSALVTSAAMPSESSEELRIVHALRLKGLADTDVVAESAGVDAERAKATLDELATSERVKYREGRMTGWMLSPDGRAHGEALLATELDEHGIRDDIDGCYRRFLELNQPFLALCTDWQVREIDGAQQPNDHTDADYDTGVIGRLADTNTSIQPICTDLAGHLARFGCYGPLFENSLAKVQAGEQEWFTKLVIPSFHTVWFELHEDLLATLGIERSTEGAH